MKDITFENINKYEESFNNNKNYKILKNALSKSNLTDIIYDNSSNEKNIFKFEEEIKTLSVCDQKSSGRCWIFAGLNILREIANKKINSTEFELSQNYIAFYDKLEKINYCLETLIELRNLDTDDRLYSHVLHNSLGDGGQWDMFVELVKKYGIVPKNAMEETYQSSNTKESSYVIKTAINKFAYESKRLNSIEEIRNLKDKLMEKMYSFLAMCFGIPPKKFDFEYKDKDGNYHLHKDLTPKEFYDEYVGVCLDDYVSIINSPTKDKPFYQMFTVRYLGNVYGKNVRYLNLPMNELIDLCKKQIKDGSLVWFGSDCSKLGDRMKGIWDDAQYDYSFFDIDLEMDKASMLDFGQSVMNHAMVISGYSRDKWKIENSWGSSRGDKGYFIMSSTWFDKYVYQVVINKKYLSDTQLKALETKEIILNPWDPMGTLAK